MKQTVMPGAAVSFAIVALLQLRRALAGWPVGWRHRHTPCGTKVAGLATPHEPQHGK